VPEHRLRGFTSTPSATRLVAIRSSEVVEARKTATLSEAEDITRPVCGSREIDYERTKTDARHAAQRVQITAPDDDAIRAFEHDAAAQGVDYVTFRRIAEATDLSPGAARDLRRHLATTRPDRYVWPLWSVAAPTAATARA
jgi:hypothetical protein